MHGLFSRPGAAQHHSAPPPRLPHAAGGAQPGYFLARGVHPAAPALAAVITDPVVLSTAAFLVQFLFGMHHSRMLFTYDETTFSFTSLSVRPRLWKSEM